MAHLKNDTSAIILKADVAFTTWSSDLRGALAHEGLVGHVFHDHPGVRSKKAPLAPAKSESEKDSKAYDIYLDQLEVWTTKDLQAYSIILRRLDPSIRPESNNTQTAKELYDMIASTHKPSAAMPYRNAYNNLLNTKFTISATDFCNDFQRNLQNFRNAAASLEAINENSMKYGISEGMASIMFFQGTAHISWLETWRATGALEKDQQSFAPVEQMMATLRAVSGNRQVSLNTNSDIIAAAPRNINPNDQCYLHPKHRHTNKECRAQHPDLRENKKNSRNGRANAAAPHEYSISDDDIPTVAMTAYSTTLPLAASASGLTITKNTLIWDTGASRHFINNRSAFTNLAKLDKPFQFDQAVHKSSLNYGGTAIVRIGNLNLQLKDALFSPQSSINLISAGRAFRLANICENREKELLEKISNNNCRTPIARLVAVGDISIILPLSQSTKKNESLSCSSIIAPTILDPAIAKPAVAKLQKCSTANRWHQRLGHVGPLILSKTKDFAKGLGGLDTSELSHCEACHLSKAQRTITREKRPTPLQALDEVFIDMVGPLEPSIFKQRYAVIITDATTRMRWWFGAVKKDEISTKLADWVAAMKNQYDKMVRICFSDGGSEIQRNSKWQEIARIKGIRQDISAPYTPEQNGPAEAANKVIITRARCLLIDAGMPTLFWPWAISHAVFLTNHLYNLTTKKVPILHFHQSLNIAHHELMDFTCLPRFGCKAYRTLNKPEKGSKFDPRAQVGWFIGFQSNTTKNALILTPYKTARSSLTWKVYYTPHAAFNENVMYGPTIEKLKQLTPQEFYSGGGLSFNNPATTENDLFPISSNSLSSNLNSLSSSYNLSNDLAIENEKSFSNDHENSENNISHDQGDSGNDELRSQEEAVSDNQYIQGEFENDDLRGQEEVESNDQCNQGESENDVSCDQENTGSNNQGESDIYDTPMLPFEPPTYAGQKRSYDSTPTPYQPSREIVLAESQNNLQPVFEEQDKIYDTPMLPFLPPTVAGQKRVHSPSPPSSPPPPMAITLRGRSVRQHDYKRLNSGRIVAPISNYTNPKSWVEAMKGPDSNNWRIAAEAEFKSLISTGTAIIVNRDQVPTNRTILTGKWVFKRKTHADGTLDKYKARWTARGFTQQKGSDYHDTFAPTPRSDTTRLLLAIGHHLSWHRLQGDVPAAFLNPNLDVVLYIRMPQGFEQKDKIIKLEKGLYGLKQAAALWHVEVRAELQKQGLEPTESDVCLFCSKAKDLFVELHVDDFQILGPDKKKIVDLAKVLQKKFDFKIITNDQFLGIHVTHQGNYLKLSQGRYARELLSRHSLIDCKPAATPMERRMELSSEPVSAKRVAEYNQIVGGLQYLANQTRPDICFATNHLARFLTNPSEEHLIAARRVLRYISKDPDAGIIFTKEKNPLLIAYSDSDFAGDPSTARSTSGSLIRLGGTISWRSHLQKDVVLSSTEAEYLALTETCRQISWMHNILEEMGLCNEVKGSRCTTILVDNQAAISLTTNHDNHKRSRHVKVRNNYCRQLYHRGQIDVKYVQTDKQQADALTKPESKVKII